MNVLTQPMPRATQSEILDGAPVDAAELYANLADLARLNRLFGTTAAQCRAALRLAAGRSAFSLLDVGTGAADFPITLRRRAARRGVSAAVFGCDRHGGVLAYPPGAALARLQADGLRLPFATGSIDILTCGQLIHHLTPAQIGGLVVELARVCRIGFVLLDLERSRAAAAAIFGLTRLVSANRLTRHDGPLSARRAYRGAEIAALAAPLGIDLTMQSVVPFRWVATWKKGRN